MKTIISIALSMSLTCLFSVVAVLAAQQASIRSQISINYEAIYLQEYLYSEIPNEITTLTFAKLPDDYIGPTPANYLESNLERINLTSTEEQSVDIDFEDIISKMKDVSIDNKGKGIANGGISLFYDPINKNTNAYILSKNPIAFPSDSSNMFNGKSNLTKIVFDNVDTCEVTKMKSMFAGCSGLIEIDIGDNFKTDNVLTMESMFDGCSELQQIDFGSSFKTTKVTRMSCMFRGCETLTRLDLSNFNTSNVKFMDEMFQRCSNLTDLIFGDEFKTDNVENMSLMFNQCKLLSGIDLSGFTNGNVVTMTSMFDTCSSLKRLDLSNFNTPKVQSMNAMFSGCTNLEEITFSENFTTENVSSMFYMFQGCKALTSLDLSSFDTSKVSDTSSMFSGCSSLKRLDLSNFNTPKVQSMNAMFSGCTNLEEIKFGENFTVANVLNMVSMFNGCKALTSLDLSYFNTDKANNMNQMFYGCTNLKEIKFGINFTAKVVFYTASMFSGCESLQKLDLSNFNTTQLLNMNEMFRNCKSLEEINFGENFKTETVYYMRELFRGCAKLTRLNLSTFDTSNIGALSHMFSGCTELEEVIFGENFNAGKVSEMNAMFYGCESLTSLNLSTFNTLNLNDTSYMFNSCSNLKEINFGDNFKTDKVTTMNSMFYACSSLGTLDISKFNTTNLSDAGYMFYGCTNLEEIKFGENFKTNKLKALTYMFSDCSKLTSLDLSSWNCDSVEYMNGLFFNCSSLKTIYVCADWNIDDIKSGTFMFNGCVSLVGGAGTRYDSSYTDIRYAKIDGGTSDPGYLTLIKAYLSKSWLTQTGALISNTAINSIAFTNVQPSTSNLVFVEGLNNPVDIGVYGSEDYSNNYKEIVKAYVYNSGEIIIYSEDIIRAQKDSSLLFSSSNTSNRLFNLTSIDFSNFVADEIVDINHIFSGLKSITSLDLSKFNTENVENMATMFVDCQSIVDLDLSHFNTQKVKSVFGMFNSCIELDTIDLSNFNLNNVVNMSYMFAYCRDLTSIAFPKDLSTVNVSGLSNNEGFYRMFYHCSSLEVLDLSDFTVNSSSNISEMFDGCSLLTTIYVGSGWDTSSATVSSNMFNECISLVGGAGTVYNSSYVDKTYAKIDGGEDDPGYFTEFAVTLVDGVTFNSKIPSGCTSIVFDYDSDKYLDIKSNATTQVVVSNSSAMQGYEAILYYNSTTRMAYVLSKASIYAASSCYKMFANGTTLTKIEFKNFNTSKVVDMEMMFYKCSGLISLDVSSFNTSNVTTMNDMFRDCSSLTSLDVSGFVTSEVTDMGNMFYNCSSLTSLDVSGFVTNEVTNMGFMFHNCSSLTSLDVSKFNTEKVTTIYSMFQGCSGLTSLDVSNFNTEEVTSMIYMFSDCSSLTSLDVSNFNTEKLKYMISMFYNCSKLTIIYVGLDWNTDSVTESTDMFTNCTSLVGGAGTTYNSSYTDKTYARIDKGTSSPGYLTLK